MAGRAHRCEVFRVTEVLDAYYAFRAARQKKG